MIKKGNYVKTPRFGSVLIEDVFNSANDAWRAGYKEPTHYQDSDYGVVGKSLDLYHMEFACYRKSEAVVERDMCQHIINTLHLDESLGRYAEEYAKCVYDTAGSLDKVDAIMEFLLQLDEIRAAATLPFTMLVTAMQDRPSRYAPYGVSTDGDEILCKTEDTAELIADILEDMGDNGVHTGSYDPEEDKRDGINDRYTGLFYIDHD